MVSYFCREALGYADASINFDSPQSNQPLVGIIDTGFNANNPDIDYSGIILGRDRIDGDNNPLLQTGEGNEHGTHVLGIIGATRGNGIGIDGINDQAPIWLGRAVGSGQWAASLVEFVDAAKASGQPNAVVNLSFDLTQTNPDGSVTTRYELTPQERQALEYARQNKVLIVAAAGNNGGTMSALGQASQEFDNIITVGSVDCTGNRADYSNYGNGLDLVAFGGTSEELVTSTLDSGADLGVLTDIDLPESSADLSPGELQAYEEAKEVAGKLKLDELDDGSVKTYLEVFNDYLSTELDALGQSSDAANEDVANHLLGIQKVFQSMQAVWEDFESVDTA